MQLTELLGVRLDWSWITSCVWSCEYCALRLLAVQLCNSPDSDDWVIVIPGTDPAVLRMLPMEWRFEEPDDYWDGPGLRLDRAQIIAQGEAPRLSRLLSEERKTLFSQPVQFKRCAGLV